MITQGGPTTGAQELLEGWAGRGGPEKARDMEKEKEAVQDLKLSGEGRARLHQSASVV